MSVLTRPGVKTHGDYIESVMISVKAKNPAEPEFHQAVAEVFDSLRLVLAKHPEYQSARLLAIGLNQLVETNIAEAWIIDVRRERCRAICRPDCAGHKSWLFRR